MTYLFTILVSFWRATGGRISGKAVAGGMSAAAIAASVAFVGPWEGLETQVYRDIVGVKTWCYGETRGVPPRGTVTKEYCDQLLATGIVEFAEKLDACIPEKGTPARVDSWRELPDGMQVAILSLTYNVGAGAACRSTLVRRVKEGRLVAACEQLPRWNRAGGRVVRGLTNRRGAERAICLRAVKEVA